MSERKGVRLLGTEFALFDPSRTKVQRAVEKFKFAVNPGPLRNLIQLLGICEFNSSFNLRTELIPDILFSASASVSRARKGTVFTPFNPEQSAEITQADFDLKERLKQELKRRENINFAENPLWLEVVSTGRQLKKAHILNLEEEIGSEDPFNPEVHDVLSRLRLQLVFPNQLEFEARSIETLGSGYLSFSHFYPADLRPFATGKSITEHWKEGKPFQEIPSSDVLASLLPISEGRAIFVPSDLDRLSQIKARFILAPEPDWIPELFRSAFEE